MRKIKTGEYRLDQSQKVHLREWPTRVKPYAKSDQAQDSYLKSQIGRLQELQSRHFAVHGNAFLVIFQGMDASGKDGTIKHVIGGMNPQGCKITSFKAPTNQELAHDFLWRTTTQLPEHGQMGIFNRSYYEDVLVPYVYPELLESLEKRMGLNRSGKKRILQGRYQSIRDHERHLVRNGTRIVKIFLHLSAHEQKKRLLARIDDPDKSWKVEGSDLRDSKKWIAYQNAYQACIGNTAAPDASWFIVPADHKPTIHLIVSQILIEAFEAMKMKAPKISPQRREQLAQFRKQLTQE